MSLNKTMSVEIATLNNFGFFDSTHLPEFLWVVLILVCVWQYFYYRHQTNHLRETLEEFATRDPLTGLQNRRVFEETLERELSVSAASSQPCSLLLLDLDHFKTINDSFGHPVGDEVLRRFGQHLEQHFEQYPAEPKMTIARYGGEEFAIIVPRTGLQQSFELAESLRKSIAQMELSFQGRSYELTSSAGVATYPEHASCSLELIESADRALFQAKANGKNQSIPFRADERA